MTGSLLVPVKALLLNVLSLTATFGAMVWIFQEGHLADLLGFTPTGSIDIFTPILMFCIAFGLSMDYEVFLLSRIKEEYDLDRDNEQAVGSGCRRPAASSPRPRCCSRSSSSGSRPPTVSIVQLFGVGLSLAVLVDAFLIRATLVPGVHAPRRPLQLVVAAAGCGAGTSATGSGRTSRSPSSTANSRPLLSQRPGRVRARTLGSTPRSGPARAATTSHALHSVVEPRRRASVGMAG